MTIKEAINMEKSSVKVSVSDSEESSVDDSSIESGSHVGSDDEEAPELEDMEADMESETDDAGNDDVILKNEGWGDSIKKILGSNKPKHKKTLVLSRAKKHSEIVKVEKEKKPDFEIIGEEEKKVIKEETIKKESKEAEPPAKKKKFEKASIRVKPNILEKDRERLLAKIATKGVVQLFNAVRNQQKTIERDVERSDISEAKKEKILRKFDKRAFLDTLMGPTKSVVVDEAASKFKDELKQETKPKWSALQDDFMTGAKMKDWDKESVDD